MRAQPLRHDLGDGPRPHNRMIGWVGTSGWVVGSGGCVVRIRWMRAGPVRVDARCGGGSGGPVTLGVPALFVAKSAPMRFAAAIGAPHGQAASTCITTSRLIDEFTFPSVDRTPPATIWVGPRPRAIASACSTTSSAKRAAHVCAVPERGRVQADTARGDRRAGVERRRALVVRRTAWTRTRCSPTHSRDVSRNPASSPGRRELRSRPFPGALPPTNRRHRLRHRDIPARDVDGPIQLYFRSPNRRVLVCDVSGEAVGVRLEVPDPRWAFAGITLGR